MCVGKGTRCEGLHDAGARNIDYFVESLGPAGRKPMSQLDAPSAELGEVVMEAGWGTDVASQRSNQHGGGELYLRSAWCSFESAHNSQSVTSPLPSIRERP